ncbi:MAG: DUF6893 family small protein [Terriglobales bacterium]
MTKWLLLGLLAVGVGFLVKREMPDIHREMKMMAM